MATKYFMAGGVDSFWASATNWSTVSSAGPNDTTKATSADDAIFDAGSPACTINSAGEGARTLTSTNYASTINIDATRVLTLQNFTSTLGGTLAGDGQITLQSGATLNGTATSASTVLLVGAGAFTLNTGANCIWGRITATAGVLTLTGNCYTKHATLATLWASGGTGTWRLYVNGDLTSSTLSGAALTPTIVMAGTGTFGTAGMSVGCNVEIDCGAGTCTFGADVRFGSSAKLFKYISGTVDSDAGVVGVFANYSFDTGGMTFHNMTVSGSPPTLTLSSALNVTNFTCNAASLSFSGAYALNFGTLIVTGGGKAIAILNGVTLTCSALYSTSHNTIPNTISCAAGGTGYINYTGTEDGYRIMWTNITRITFIGRKIYNWWGTNTTVTNGSVVATTSPRLVMPQLVGV
jgi:hypothetical protein